MLDPDALVELRERIIERTQADKLILDILCDEIRQVKSDVRKIQPRSATAVSLVASDGGNNKLAFDPFLMQLVRVTDSYGKELCLDVVSPTTDTDELSKRQFDNDGTPRTALGKMMVDLGETTLSNLSPMIPSGKRIREDPHSVKPGWVLAYRDLCEWAVLYDRIVFESFATNTLIVRDGLLRSPLFNRELFSRWRKNVEAAIGKIYQRDKRKIFLIGVAKHSKVVDRYRLAMGIEDVFPSGEPWFVPIPRHIEAKTYIWEEYARGGELYESQYNAPGLVAGDMFLVRFGKRSGDPIWPVDIFINQGQYAQEVFGYLLNDAIDGFPIPFYPLCLQQAHEHAQIVDFDLEIFQDQIFNSVRGCLSATKRDVVDSIRFHSDISQRRYE